MDKQKVRANFWPYWSSLLINFITERKGDCGEGLKGMPVHLPTVSRQHQLRIPIKNRRIKGNKRKKRTAKFCARKFEFCQIWAKRSQ